MRFFFITSLLFTLFNKSYSQGKFTVQGRFNNYNGKVYLLIDKVKDSVYTSKGSFLFKGEVSRPSYSYISIPSRSNKMVGLSGFWIDKEETILELDTVPFKNSRFSGINIKTKLIKSGEAEKIVSESIAQLSKIKSEDIAETEKKIKLKSITDDLLKIYPNSIISLYVLVGNLKVYTQNELQLIYQGLSPELKSTREALLIKTEHVRTYDIAIGSQLPNFTQASPSGKLISLADIKAKYILVDFWASWCVPCRKENPAVVKAYKNYKDKGLEILGVSLDHEKEPWVNAIKKDGLSWLHVSDLGGWENELAVSLKIKSVPTNLLIDENRKIIAIGLRGSELEQKLEELLGTSK